MFVQSYDYPNLNTTHSKSSPDLPAYYKKLSETRQKSFSKSVDNFDMYIYSSSFSQIPNLSELYEVEPSLDDESPVEPPLSEVHNIIPSEPYIRPNPKSFPDINEDQGSYSDLTKASRFPNSKSFEDFRATLTKSSSFAKPARLKRSESGGPGLWPHISRPSHVVIAQPDPFVDLLHLVHKMKLFEGDSKDFVDMPLVCPLDVMWNNFSQLELNSSELRTFLQYHFGPPGSDSEDAELTDWKPEHPLCKTIKEPSLQKWLNGLQDLWKNFGRSVCTTQYHTTLLWVPHPYVVPGGRFREFYYWDSFWIVLGLLYSGMLVTAKGIILNMLYLIQQHGFIPNGTRRYYLNRSQPPMLVEMVHWINKLHPNTEFLAECVWGLEVEYNFWMGARSVPVDIPEWGTVLLNRFFVSTNCPRPESHKEDLHLSSGMENEKAFKLYADLAAAAESGWDFSSRWASNPNDLSTCHTSDFLPVDLNCIMYIMEMRMAEFHRQLRDTPYHQEKRFIVYGKEAKANLLLQYLQSIGNVVDFVKLEEGRWFVVFRDVIENLSGRKVEIDGVEVEIKSGSTSYFQQQATRRSAAMNALMWDKRTFQWYDYNHVSGKRSKIVSSSNFFPIWAGCCTDVQAELSAEALRRSPLLQAGGVSATALATNQQWDFPCGWAPVQWFLVEGLRRLNTEKTKALAKDIALRWLMSNYIGWEKDGKMYEKYNVCNPGSTGYGGEYTQQDGFGWTNGVAIYFMSLYGRDLEELLKKQTN